MPLVDGLEELKLLQGLKGEQFWNSYRIPNIIDAYCRIICFIHLKLTKNYVSHCEIVVSWCKNLKELDLE